MLTKPVVPCPPCSLLLDLFNPVALEPEPLGGTEDAQGVKAKG